MHKYSYFYQNIDIYYKRTYEKEIDRKRKKVKGHHYD